MRVAYDPEFTAAELPVPLFPRRSRADAAGARLLGLRGPDFARAHLLSAAWAAGTAAVALVSLVLAPPWRGPVEACAVLLGLWLLLRVCALLRFERRQRAFEPRWLASQTGVLQRHAFDVLRFSVRPVEYGSVDTARTYDLTRSGDVRDLLGRQDRERASGGFSQAAVEFAHWAGPGSLPAVAEVHRELTELTFVRRRTGPARVGVRFPEASYHGVPATGRHPATAGRWVLSGPVVVTVGPPYAGGDESAEVLGLDSAR